MIPRGWLPLSSKILSKKDDLGQRKAAGICKWLEKGKCENRKAY
jgi:hypothetical protein